jgi:hypothetical protein
LCHTKSKQAETAEYIEEIVAELIKLAREAELGLVAHILEMAGLAALEVRQPAVKDHRTAA